MKIKSLLISLLLLSLVAMAQVVIDGNVTSDQTWTSDNEYLLDGQIFVEPGATLTIEAGTVIKVKQVPTDTSFNAGALICSRGARIIAAGNASAPIIMTSEFDNLADPFDLLPTDRGLWGGLIILGNATLNNASGIANIEGIDPNEPLGEFGGNDDADNSGVYTYISVRHGGAELAPGDEINAVTLGGVGSATIVNHIEAYANVDDGFEWFGGTVNTSHLVAAFNADDGFDYDVGFRGKHQFWFAVQAEDAGGRTAEMDGGTDPEDGEPYATPFIVNATYIGPGVSNFPEGDGASMLIFRDNAGGQYHNSIFTEYNGGEGGAGVIVEDLGSGSDSRERLESGDLVLSNNIWWGFANGNDLADFAEQDFVQTHLADNGNIIEDPQLISVSRSNDGLLDPRPSMTGVAASGATDFSDEFIEAVNYYGAFDPASDVLWIAGWTALAAEGVTGIEEGVISTLPSEFTLKQNFPNPFNPSTTIEYRLPSAADVLLKVYNISGQEVATLINGMRGAGSYTVEWNASDLPTGVYFYTLDAAGQIQTRKMILIQ